MESKKKWYKWTYLQNRNRLTDLEKDWPLPGRRGKGGIVREFENNMYTLLYLKWITNKDLLYSTGNSAQCYVATWVGGEFEQEWIYMAESPALHLKSSHCSSAMCVSWWAQSAQLCNPMQRSTPGSSIWDSPGKNTGLGCHFLLYGIFPTYGSNPGLLHCRWILYCLGYQGRPLISYIPT